MKKNLILIVSLIAAMVAIAGAYALPQETANTEPEKIVFVNIDEEVDGTSPDVLTGARFEDPDVSGVRITEETNEQQETVDGFVPDVLNEEQAARLPKCD